MASCKHSNETTAGNYQMKIGNEMVTFVRIECADCGAGLRNEIIARDKIEDDKK